MDLLLLGRLSVTAVWLYEGLWCKLLDRAPAQVEVVGSVPLLDAGTARQVLRAIGVAECGLALWVLSGWQPVLAATAQTALLVGMNTGGLLYARHLIHDPAGMVLKNIAFLLLAWHVGLGARPAAG